MAQTLSFSLTIGYNAPLAPPLSGTLPQGTLTALLGANGTGKTTLLRTLSGLLRPIEGMVHIGKQNLLSLSRRERARSVAVVLTAQTIVPELTAEEVVATGRMPYTGFSGWLSRNDKRLVAQSLSDVGASHLASRHMGTLSDGERQRVLIAKALAQDTPFIFCDEPTAFLDFSAKPSVLRLLANLATHRDKAILLSTHDVEPALRLAHRLWLLSAANGLCEGTTATLAQSGILTAFFAAQGVTFHPDTLQLDY